MKCKDINPLVIHISDGVGSVGHVAASEHFTAGPCVCPTGSWTGVQEAGQQLLLENRGAALRRSAWCWASNKLHQHCAQKMLNGGNSHCHKTHVVSLCLTLTWDMKQVPQPSPKRHTNLSDQRHWALIVNQGCQIVTQQLKWCNNHYKSAMGSSSIDVGWSFGKAFMQLQFNSIMAEMHDWCSNGTKHDDEHESTSGHGNKNCSWKIFQQKTWKQFKNNQNTIHWPDENKLGFRCFKPKENKTKNEKITWLKNLPNWTQLKTAWGTDANLFGQDCDW